MLVAPMTDRDRRPVLFASYSGLLGGAERVLLDAATRLGRPLVVACPEGPLAERLRAAGLPHAPLASRDLRLGPAHAAGLLGLARELGTLSRRHHAAALVAWGARAVLAAALLPRSVRPPLLAVPHDLLPRPTVRAAVRTATRRSDAVAAASAAIAHGLGLDAVVASGDAVGAAGRLGFTGPRTAGEAAGTHAHSAAGRADRPGGAIVLHPGVDLAVFAPAPAPDGPPRALVLGALVGWKRPDLALKVAERMPELRLTFAGAPLPGDEGYAAALRGRAAALGDRVAFAGALSDVPAALADAHCLLHCADAEPYGLAMVEALACGRPVVAPAAAGPLEIVADGAGRLYPPGDAAAAAAAIRAVVADPEAGAAARRR